MRNRPEECLNRGESPAGPLTGAVARDIARAIHDGLTEGGLMSHVIREVACALLAFSLTAQRDHVALPTWGRKTKFFSRGDDRKPAPVLPKPDRGWAEVVSPEPRILCALLLDVSGSMFERGALEVVTRALPEFRAALLKHEETTRRLSWAVLTYAGTLKVVQPYGPIAPWEPPARLDFGGGTAMGTAILEMLRQQEEHIGALALQGISYQHGFCFHVTDGEPNNEPPERLDEAARLIAETERNHFSFYSIAVEGADIDTLRRLTPRRTPLKLADVKDFHKFFHWLEVSMTTVLRSRGRAVELPSPLRTKEKEGGEDKKTQSGNASGGDKAEGENAIGWGEVPA